MAKFIRVTLLDLSVDETHINVDSINAVFIYEGKTHLNVTGSSSAFEVAETVDMIMQLISEKEH